MRPVYYNEIDPFAAQWLRNLIAGGHLPAGDVDERSIADVQPDDLRGYGACHFFAGIGGWPLAVRLAGLADDCGIWTGSCPCQPFSAAGKKQGFADPRHLWPEFHRLIRELRPERVVGEQVASATAWLDLVSGDLEAEGYAVGAVVLGAHSVGAPHIRQRIYWVADRAGARRQVGADRADGRRPTQPERLCPAHGLGDRLGAGLEGHGRSEHVDDAQGREAAERHHWASGVWAACTDGRLRPIPAEPVLFPLADGVRAGRVGILRGAGNAIVPQVAAAFLRALY